MKEENNWYVITGAPYSGKTSVIELLDKKGYSVVYEAARVYIDQEIKKGKTIEAIRKNELEFQKGILDKKIEIEKKLSKKQIIFFDRAIPDSDAYYKLCGIGDDKYLDSAVKKSKYKKVFLFNLLPYEKDYARIENEEEQVKLQKLLEESYKKINLPIIKVPVMESVEDRISFILKNI